MEIVTYLILNMTPNFFLYKIHMDTTVSHKTLHELTMTISLIHVALLSLSVTVFQLLVFSLSSKDRRLIPCMTSTLTLPEPLLYSYMLEDGKCSGNKIRVRQSEVEG